jgi:hypothetical protein
LVAGFVEEVDDVGVREVGPSPGALADATNAVQEEAAPRRGQKPSILT